MGACTSKKDRSTAAPLQLNAAAPRFAAPTARPKAAPNHDCSKCEYVIVCCGAPKRGMGWFHATQLLSNRCPSAQLVEVVEPYLLGGGRDTADGRAFASWAQKTSGVRFLSRVADIGQPEQGRAKIALLAPRVEDAAELFHQVLETGMVTNAVSLCPTLCRTVSLYVCLTVSHSVICLLCNIFNPISHQCLCARRGTTASYSLLMLQTHIRRLTLSVLSAFSLHPTLE